MTLRYRRYMHMYIYTALKFLAHFITVHHTTLPAYIQRMLLNLLLHRCMHHSFPLWRPTYRHTYYIRTYIHLHSLHNVAYILTKLHYIPLHYVTTNNQTYWHLLYVNAVHVTYTHISHTHIHTDAQRFTLTIKQSYTQAPDLLFYARWTSIVNLRWSSFLSTNHDGEISA
jgi:hypothetical protein